MFLGIGLQVQACDRHESGRDSLWRSTMLEQHASGVQVIPNGISSVPGD